MKLEDSSLSLHPSPLTFTHADFTLRQAEGTAYDGDGARVKFVMTTTLGSSTTYFVNNYYEVTDGVITKYYYAGSQRIAMRKGGTLTYILGDHLGSTSLVTDAAGNVTSELRYSAWGEVRYQAGTSPTNYTYTGQYDNTADFGLMYYNARWYDPSLGRFAQADSIVPAGVQGYDRYAYVQNNPIRYTDPSGHCWTLPTLIICAGAVVIAVKLYNAYHYGVEEERDQLFVTAEPRPTYEYLGPPMLSSGPTRTPTPKPLNTPDLESILTPLNQTCPSKTNPCLPPSQVPTNTITNTPTNTDETPTNAPSNRSTRTPMNTPANSLTHIHNPIPPRRFGGPIMD